MTTVATEAIAKELLYSYGAIIVLLISIIGYFLNKWIRAIEGLTDAVGSLKVIIGIIQNNQTNFSESCNYKHSIIDNRLKKHSEKLEEFTDEITKVKLDVVSHHK